MCDKVKYLVREFTSCYTEVIRFHLDKKYNIEQNDDLNELLQDDNIFVRAIEEMVADRALITYSEQNLGLVKAAAYKVSTPTGESMQVKETFQYVSISEMLPRIVMGEGVWDNINREVMSSDDLLQDFTNGDIFKNHEIFGSRQLVLRIHLYADEFEICNPIGSKRKKT